MMTLYETVKISADKTAGQRVGSFVPIQKTPVARGMTWKWLEKWSKDKDRFPSSVVIFAGVT